MSPNQNQKQHRKYLWQRVRIRNGILFLGCATALGLLAPTFGQTSQHTTGYNTIVEFQYYQVSGQSESELLDSMLKRGPRRNGRSFFALTESLTGFTYKTVRSNGTCKLADVNVTTQVVVTLPQWPGAASASSELATQWRVFEVALQNHERWHVGSAKRTTRQIHEALQALSEPDCLLVENKAKHISQAILAASEQENIQYDRNTGHGKSHGASWPP